MKYLYSKTTRGMYLDSLHENIPADAVEVSDEDYRKLIAGQEQGLEIVPDASGKPVLREPPKPTADDIEKAAEK